MKFGLLDAPALQMQTPGNSGVSVDEVRVARCSTPALKLMDCVLCVSR